MNVSSIVVTAAPENIADVVAGINSMDFCEVHFHDKRGRVVVTIEGDTIHEQMERLKLVQALPSVIGAHLIFSYCEDEITESIDAINQKRQGEIH